MSPATAPARDQRARILDTALTLMSERGSADTSMRTLATACDLNVATLYHYFPSKTELLRSVIEERGWFALLADTGIGEFDLEQPVEERLVDFLAFLSEATLAEEAPTRLLLGEGLRQDPTAAATVTALLAAIDEAMARWMADGFPELAGDPAARGRLVRRLLVARLVERLATAGLPVEDDRAWATEVAQALLQP